MANVSNAGQWPSGHRPTWKQWGSLLNKRRQGILWDEAFKWGVRPKDKEMAKIDAPQISTHVKDKDIHIPSNMQSLEHALCWIPKRTRRRSYHGVSSTERDACGSTTHNAIWEAWEGLYVGDGGKQQRFRERAYVLVNPLSYVQTGDEPRMDSTI